MHFKTVLDEPSVWRGWMRVTQGDSFVKRGCVWALRGVTVSLLWTGLAGGQSAKDSSLYVRAQQMVANGDAANGRKLADSVAAAAPAGSASFAEGLFWRATLAANARDSEHYYRQIIVDYPLSGRVPDALLRIGQLEATRGENAAALQHFQRLVLEHPDSPLRADASYWVARMYFEANDATRACTANADALSAVGRSNVELRNRIDFQQQRCRGVALGARSAPVPAAVPAKSAPAAAPALAKSDAKNEAKVASGTVEKTATKVASTTPRANSGDTNRNAVASSAVASSASSGGTSSVVSRSPTDEEVARVLAASRNPASARALKVGIPKRTDAGTTTRPAAGVPARDSAEPAEVASTSTRAGGSYAVQVAAYATRSPANSLVAKLRKRGYNCYVDGTSAPYRVRIGHYPTRAAAAAALVKLKATHIDGFVVEK